MKHGNALMQLLKQPLCNPLSLPEQVITLTLANAGFFDKVDTKKVKELQKEILDFVDINHKDIINEIETNRVLSDELAEKIKAAGDEYNNK